MRNYLQHGRRHAPTGSDPIPGLGDMLWAAMSSPSIVTINAGTTKIVDMNAANIYTNASNVFAIGAWTHSAVTYHGIKVLQDGHYLATGQAQIGGFQSATTGYINALWQNQPGGPASYGSGGAFLNCPIAVATGQWNPEIQGLTTVNGGSTDIWIMQVHNTTSVDITGYLDMFVYQIDTDTTHIF